MCQEAINIQGTHRKGQAEADTPEGIIQTEHW